MHKISRLAGILFATLALTPLSAQGQVALMYFDAQSIRTACAGGGDCSRLVQLAIAQIRGSRLSGVAVNQQLAVLAATVIESSQAGGTGGAPQVTQALQNIVTNISDPVQREVVAQAAGTLATGGPVDILSVANSASSG